MSTQTVTLPSFKELMQEIQEMEILHSIEKPHFAPAVRSSFPVAFPPSNALLSTNKRD